MYNVVLRAEWQDYKVSGFPFDRCYLSRILAPRECRKRKMTKRNKNWQQAAKTNQVQKYFKTKYTRIMRDEKLRVSTFTYPFKEESNVTLPLRFDCTTMHLMGLLDPPNFSFTLRICWLKTYFWYKPNRENGNLFCILRAKDYLYCSPPGENTAYDKDKTYLIFVHKPDLILFGVFKISQWWNKNKFWTPVIIPIWLLSNLLLQIDIWHCLPQLNLTSITASHIIHFTDFYIPCKSFSSRKPN